MMILRFFGSIFHNLLKIIAVILQVVLSFMSIVICFVGGTVSVIGGLIGSVFVLASFGTLIMGISAQSEFWGMLTVGIIIGVFPNIIREIGRQGIEGIKRVLSRI